MGCEEKCVELLVHTGLNFALTWKTQTTGAESVYQVSHLFAGTELGLLDQMRRGEKGVPGEHQSSGQTLKLHLKLSRVPQIISMAIHSAGINGEQNKGG